MSDNDPPQPTPTPPPPPDTDWITTKSVKASEPKTAGSTFLGAKDNAPSLGSTDA